jgi:hypothetical protein
MNKKQFFEYAKKQVPKGMYISAINFLVFENRYVALLANVGELYPFRGRIYEPA